MKVVRVPYVCRHCDTATGIYVEPEEPGDDELELTDNHRIVSAECEECGVERVHVLAFALADPDAHLEGWDR